ncbi:MAG: hypothetical protein H0Z34_15890 [Brevibacillus sp.]|nr:hypothetical protein [Brevibacillus sp.]
MFSLFDFANSTSGASPKRGHTGATWTSGGAALLLRPPASGWRSEQYGFMGGWQRREARKIASSPYPDTFVYTLHRGAPSAGSRASLLARPQREQDKWGLRDYSLCG